MTAAARGWLLKTGNGVRLLGSYARQRRAAKGLVVLLHGWEGSMDSTYMLSSGGTFFRNGYDVFRLNLRDHGPTHHLNTGIFLATMLDEVFDSVAAVCRRSAPLPVFLMGFSLGGNFVLRIVRRCRRTPLDRLAHAVAVSPVLDPEKATRAIDGNFLLRRYFIKKWRRSLRRKAEIFPERYRFDDVLKISSLQGMTEALIPRSSRFKDAAAYFRAYAFNDGDFAGITVPTTVVTAADDPVIPVEDFLRLKPSDVGRVIVHRRGGHIGFFTGLCSTWYESMAVALFDAVAAGSAPPPLPATGNRRPG
jgi:predicted alpha/beta-fold hydrolase